MKYVLLTLLFVSCAHRKPLVKQNKETFHFNRVEACMEKFSKHGFDADGIVKICKEVFNRNK